MDYKARHRAIRELAIGRGFSLEEMAKGRYWLDFGVWVIDPSIAPLDALGEVSATTEKDRPFSAFTEIKSAGGRIGYGIQGAGFPSLEALLLCETYKPGYSVETILTDYLIDVFAVEEKENTRRNVHAHVKRNYDTYCELAIAMATIRNEGAEPPTSAKEAVTAWLRMRGQTYRETTKALFDECKALMDKYTAELLAEDGCRELMDEITGGKVSGAEIVSRAKKGGKAAEYALRISAVLSLANDLARLSKEGVEAIELAERELTAAHLKELEKAFRWLMSIGAEVWRIQEKTEEEAEPMPPTTTDQEEGQKRNEIAPLDPVIRLASFLFSGSDKARKEEIERFNQFKAKRAEEARREKELKAKKKEARERQEEARKAEEEGREDAQELREKAVFLSAEVDDMDANLKAFSASLDAEGGKNAPYNMMNNGGEIRVFRSDNVEAVQIDPSTTRVYARRPPQNKSGDGKIEIWIEAPNDYYIKLGALDRAILNWVLDLARERQENRIVITKEMALAEFKPQTTDEAAKSKYWNEMFKPAARRLVTPSMHVTYTPTRNEAEKGGRKAYAYGLHAGWLSVEESQYQNRAEITITINEVFYGNMHKSLYRPKTANAGRERSPEAMNVARTLQDRAYINGGKAIVPDKVLLNEASPGLKKDQENHPKRVSEKIEAYEQESSGYFKRLDHDRERGETHVELWDEDKPKKPR